MEKNLVFTKEELKVIVGRLCTVPTKHKDFRIADHIIQKICDSL